MKLPRWLVIGMLTSSVLAVLAAAGWWWVTWPERTAREFAELISAGKFDEAKRFLRPMDEPPKEEPPNRRSQMYMPLLGSSVASEFALDEPTLLDIVVGRRSFRMQYSLDSFTAQCGSVTRFPIRFFIENSLDWSTFQKMPEEDVSKPAEAADSIAGDAP